jgi:hypothetical protein
MNPAVDGIVEHASGKMTIEEREFVIREVGEVKVTANGNRYVTCRTDLGRVAFWGTAENQRNIRQIEQYVVPFTVRVGAMASRWSQHVLWVPQTARIRLVSSGATGRRHDGRGRSTRDSSTGERSHGRPTAGPSMPGAFDPYDVLGVSKGASLATVTAAYRDLIKQYHPDQVARLGKELRDLAHRKTQDINRAYEMLIGGRK